VFVYSRSPKVALEEGGVGSILFYPISIKKKPDKKKKKKQKLSLFNSFNITSNSILFLYIILHIVIAYINLKPIAAIHIILNPKLHAIY